MRLQVFFIYAQNISIADRIQSGSRLVQKKRLTMSKSYIFFLLFCASNFIRSTYGRADDVILPCSSSPCQHSGTCTNIGSVDFQCNCAVNYYGRSCENRLPCAGDPCLNGGTCTSISRTEFTCVCSEGYHGDRCEFAKPCLSNPCKHRSMCSDVPVDINIDVIEGDDVIPEAQVNMTYQCACHPGYHGLQCEEHMPCLSNPCHNGGTCTDVGYDDFKCACPAGKTGHMCEYDVTCDSGEEYANISHASFYHSYGRRPVNPGTSKEVRCNRGYYATSNNKRTSMTCQNNGSWVMTQPCKPLTCPTQIPNADIISHHDGNHGNVSLREVVSYQCHEG